MSDLPFVGRERELLALEGFLDKARAGSAQTAFIAGEAGAGKSALVNEFIRRAADDDLKVVSAIGECNAQSGIGDPYLPFRQLLTTLTGAAGEEPSPEAGGPANRARLKEWTHIAGQTLLDVGPDLIGIFVPGAGLIAKVATRAATHSKIVDRLADKLARGAQSPAGTGLSPELDQTKIFEQFTDVLRALAKDRDLILILDDLQWADSSSLNLLFHLARQLRDSHVLLVGTYRPDDVAMGRAGERHPLEPIINELKRYGGEIVIDLSAGGTGEGRAFVDTLIDAEPNRLTTEFREQLFVRTEGHALFTVELLRDLRERGDLIKDGEGRWVQAATLDWTALPARVEGVVVERIGRLSSKLHEELSVASVIGVNFTAQAIARVLNLAERELIKELSRELDKRYRLVQEQGESRVGRLFLSEYRFTHALIQQFLYNELGAGERRLWHGDVATTLEALYEGQPDTVSVQLAHHFELAGEDEKAIDYLTRAGDAASTAYAQAEAIQFYSRALNLCSRQAATTDQLKYLYMRRGRAFELDHQFDRALENYVEMVDLARLRHDRSLELAALLATATLHSVVSGVPDAAKGDQLSRQALGLARESGDQAAEARALWNLMLVHMYLKGDPGRAIEFGEQSLTIARERNLREQIAYSTGDLGVAYSLNGQLDQAEDRFAEAAAIWRELGNLPMLSFTLSFSMTNFLVRGRYQQLLSGAGEILEISGTTRTAWNRGPVLLWQAFIWLEYGEVGKAIQSLLESFGPLEQMNRTEFLTEGRALLTWYYTTLGAFDVAAEHYRNFRRPAEEMEIPLFQVLVWSLYALYEIASGQLETAETTLHGCTFDLRMPGATWTFLAKSQLAFVRGDYPQAIRLAEQTAAYMRQAGLDQFLPDLLFVKARAHLELGERNLAKDSLKEAGEAAERLGSRRMQWPILAAMADLETDPDQAAALREQARQITRYIADHTGAEELRLAFLQLPEVRAVMNSG